MNRRLLYTTLLTLLSSLILPLAAEPRASLITCGQSAEYVFYLYGHTAIRIQDPETGLDRAYNYGYFSTSQKNFIPNFMIGKPMYMLGVTDFDSMVYDYADQGRSMVEQELSLRPQEVRELMEYLDWNALPENAEYQYNYFYDNCATRPRDLIERFVQGGLVYRVDRKSLPTFREATRQSSKSAKWYTFGTDLCLGVKSDAQMTVRDAGFLPVLLEQSMDLAYREDTGEPIVVRKQEIIPQTQVIEVPRFDGPLVTILAVVAVYLLCYFVVRRYTPLPWRILRCALYVIFGLAGIVLWFLSLFSAHPHTLLNANMVLLHPFWLILVVTMWQEGRHKRLNSRLYLINLLLSLVYLGLGYVQTLPIGMAYMAILIGLDQFVCRFVEPSPEGGKVFDYSTK